MRVENTHRPLDNIDAREHKKINKQIKKIIINE